MQSVYTRYNIPYEVIGMIQEYYIDWKDYFKHCITSIETGTHVALKVSDNKTVDIFRIMINNSMLYVPLSKPYNKNNNPYISKSIPLFHCYRCRCYHMRIGTKICTKYGIHI